MKPIVFKTVSLEKPFEANITYTYDKATGNTNLSKQINTIIEREIISTLSVTTTNLDATLKDFNSEYIAFKADFYDTAKPVLKLDIETEITYQSKTIITMVISTYEFRGDAHGNNSIKFLNLNPSIRNTLGINDIIAVNADFKALAKTYFVKAFDDEYEGLNMGYFFFGKPFQLPENIGFSEDGIVFLYSPYDVLPFNRGFTEFVIPFEKASEYLKVN